MECKTDRFWNISSEYKNELKRKVLTIMKTLHKLIH